MGLFSSLEQWLDKQTVCRGLFLLGPDVRPSEFNSTALVHKLWPVYSPIGDSARPDQHAVARLTGEVARVSHRSVVLALGASKLQSQPDPGSKARGAHVPNGPHLVGAGEEDLRALVQLHAPFHAAGRGGPAPAAAQRRFPPARRGGQGTGQCAGGVHTLSHAVVCAPAAAGGPVYSQAAFILSSNTRMYFRSVFKMVLSLGYFNTTLKWI